MNLRITPAPERTNLVKTYQRVCPNILLEPGNAIYATGLFFAKTGNIFREAEVVGEVLLVAKELGIKEGLDKSELDTVLAATAMRATDARVRYTLLSAVAAMTKLAADAGKKLFELSSLGDPGNQNMVGHRKNYELGLGKAEAVFLDAGAIMAGSADLISNAAKVKLGLISEPEEVEVVEPVVVGPEITESEVIVVQPEILEPEVVGSPSLGHVQSPSLGYDFDDLDLN